MKNPNFINILSRIKALIKSPLEIGLFFILLQVYLINGVLASIEKKKFVPTNLLRRLRIFLLGRLLRKLDRGEEGSISQREIIRLAIKNMGVKRTRSLITIGGMSIGIGAIVFLVSIGFGLQDLVISRVARLEEMKQADVMPNPAGNLFIDDEVLARFKDIAGVQKVFPVISLVGRVNFQNSITDVVVHGVTRDYLDNSAITPISGNFFKSNETVVSLTPPEEEAVSGENEEKNDDFLATIQPVGILGEATPSADPELLELLETLKPPSEEEKEFVPLGNEARREVVINKSMAQILGLEPQEALNGNVTISFVVVGDLIPESEGKKIESHPAEYTIVGVVPGEKNPVIWVPFLDLRSLGITRYSQARVMVAAESDLPRVRKQIEAMGYKTTSVADTVVQIKNLFRTARLILAALGAIALAVASLGMFNTLTISLLERTREVGVMKVMGMKENEVRNLFLTESMLMGFLGGIFGIVLGVIAGKMLGIIISLMSFTKSPGFIDIASLPSPFVVAIIFLSLIVGFFTGIYPTRRAAKISALDALRYE